MPENSTFKQSKIMASGPITSWQIDGEAVRDFIFLGSKITAEDDCSHEIKRCLLLGRKVMTNLVQFSSVAQSCLILCDPMNRSTPRQHIKKQRHYLAHKGLSSQSYGFPVVMCGYESWTIKNAEYWRTDAFEVWCWRRLLRVPWTARRSNQSILKEISPEYSLEGLMLKLKLQYFGHMMQSTDSLEKSFSDAGKD